MTTSSDAPFILVDGSSYLFRAYHALPPLMNSKGQPMGAVYGVVNMINKLVTDYPTDNIVIVFDAKGKTFRNDLYELYKANRPPMPDDLRGQIQPLHEIIEAMGYPILVIDYVEADDVIGTLARQAAKAGMNTLISTGDKDMAQLVDEHVTLINTMTNQIMDDDFVEVKFGVKPNQIIDFLAMTGDTADNIPGVPGLGPKTASKLLKEHGDLDTIIENAESIKGKMGERFREAIPQLPLYKELVTIKEDVSLSQMPEALIRNSPDRETLVELCTQYEFKRWLKEFSEEVPIPVKKSAYSTILSKKEWSTWLGKLQKAKTFAFDTETTSLNYMQAKIVGLSFCIKEGEAAYLPLAHDYEGAREQLDLDTVLNDLKPLLEDPSKKIIAQNLKYDKEVLANYDISLSSTGFDTMLESYVLNSTATRHDMDSLAKHYLNTQTVSYEEVAGKGVKQVTFNHVPIDIASDYAAEDADVTFQLHAVLWKALEEEKSLKHVFENIEMPLVPVLARIERTGVLIDTKRLKKQSDDIAKTLETLAGKAFDIAGKEFNLNSPKQLQEILYEELKLPVLKKTPKGQPSTAEPVLQELAFDYPLPEIILSYRSLSKLKSTYTDTLPEQIDETTGRVHTSYHQAVTATGRLSSSTPNLQNIPVRTEEGRRIRKAFIVPEGYKMLAADYSQIELRIMAHLSKDKGLIHAFENNLDIHKATAAEVFSTPLEDVTTDQRRSAKAINFGLIYGMSAFGLSKQLGIDRSSAQTYIDLYFSRYPGVSDYMEKTIALAHEQGFVETLFGRRLYLPEINARNIQRQKASERTAINAPLQGTAADMIKQAMIRMDSWLQETTLDARMLMQVHDELVFEVAEKDIDACSKEVIAHMTSGFDLAVPIIVDVGVGENWDEAH